MSLFESSAGWAVSLSAETMSLAEFVRIQTDAISGLSPGVVWTAYQHAIEHLAGPHRLLPLPLSAPTLYRKVGARSMAGLGGGIEFGTTQPDGALGGQTARVRVPVFLPDVQYPFDNQEALSVAAGLDTVAMYCDLADLDAAPDLSRLNNTPGPVIIELPQPERLR